MKPRSSPIPSLSILQLSALAAVALSVSAQAATLAHYDFEDVTGEPKGATFSSAASTSALGVASAITYSNTTRSILDRNITNTGPNATYFTTSANGTITVGAASGREVAVDHGGPIDFGINSAEYFTFTYTADDGGDGVSLETISLDFAAPGAANTSGNRGFEVQYSIEGAALVSAGWGRRFMLDGAPVNTGPNYALSLGNVRLDAGESVEFRIYKTNQPGVGNEVRYDNIKLTGSGPSSGGDYADWIANYPGIGSLAGFDDDPDGDGVPNGAESFLGTDPSVGSPSLFGASAGASTLTFKHSESNAIPSDVTGTYEWSLDLVNWYAGGGDNGAGVSVSFSEDSRMDNSAPDNDEVTVTATVTGGAGARLFVRLKAVLAP